MTTGVTCTNAERGCRGIATPQHPECSRCQRERKLAAMRESSSIGARTLACLIEHMPHHDLELEELEAG